MDASLMFWDPSVTKLSEKKNPVLEKSGSFFPLPTCVCMRVVVSGDKSDSMEKLGQRKKCCAWLVPMLFQLVAGQ